MSAILRNVEQAASEQYDVIIAGGGIYGSMLMLEAVRAGLRPLLLERSDFGAGTSFNNLRIVHGGLRYLQTLNFPRIRESVAERRWFLETFPELIQPIPCLMPLYGGLTKNRLVMATALRMNDWLTRERNVGLSTSQHIPDCEMLSAAETLEHFPLARTAGLKGGALWYDAAMPDCQRVQIEILRWVTAGGGVALNYTEVTNLLTKGDDVVGVRATDIVSGQEYEFRAAIVINATGPLCRDFARKNDIDRVELFRPSHAWNMLLDRPPLSNGAVAIEAPISNSRVFFAHSLADRLLVGTGHVKMRADDPAELQESHIIAMLDELNKAVPTLDVGTDDVIRLFSGQLPVDVSGTVQLSDKPVILDHHDHGGRRGLFTVSGVKYTTSRSTAETAIKYILRTRGDKSSPSKTGLPVRPQDREYKLHPRDCPARNERIRRMQDIIQHESARTLADVLLRRSNLASDPATAMLVAKECCDAFSWDANTCTSNMTEFGHELGIRT